MIPIREDVNNKFRDRDKAFVLMLGISYRFWCRHMTREERASLREVWARTPDEDRQLPPAEWQMKYLGRPFSTRGCGTW